MSRTIFGHTVYDSKEDAKAEIGIFKDLHPKSKRKFRIIKTIYYIIEEE
jgi:hypothetical protein